MSRRSRRRHDAASMARTTGLSRRSRVTADHGMRGKHAVAAILAPARARGGSVLDTCIFKSELKGFAVRSLSRDAGSGGRCICRLPT